MASHPKSAPTERSGHPAKVQDGYSSECNEHSRRGHQVGQGCVLRRGGGIGPLGGLLGSSGRVFSRCHKSKGHKISPLRLRRGNFRISGPTFRALDRPQDVHSPGKGNRCLPEDVWYKHLPVPRRLARRRRDPPVSSQLQGHGQHDNSESGLPHQRGKVRLDADPVPNVPGLGSRSCPDDGVSVRGPNRSSETPDPTDHEVPGKPGETMEVSLRYLASMIQLVPKARRHIRPLQYFIQERWDLSMPDSHLVTRNSKAREELPWWLHTPNLTSGVPFSDPDPELTVVTDASSFGWGGHLGDLTASGTWPAQWQSKHINWLELQAVWLTLKHFQSQVSGTAVEILSDNSTTVSYINKQGGTHSLSLCKLALDLWDWCDLHQITPTAVHLAGVDNVLADALSRGNYCPTEWSLHRPTFMSLWQVWDRPFVDMFATARNSQLPVYYSLGVDHQASGTNALTMNWDLIFRYAYPPTSLLDYSLHFSWTDPDVEFGQTL